MSHFPPMRFCFRARDLSAKPDKQRVRVDYTPLLPHDGGELYLHNLEQLYLRLKSALAPNGKVIWRTTTPVPPSYTKRNNTDIVAVNALAAQLFGPGSKYPEVAVHDLYSQVVQRCNNPPKGAAKNNDTRGYPQTSDCFDVQSRGVHFSDAGIQLTAVLTAASILPHL